MSNMKRLRLLAVKLARRAGREAAKRFRRADAPLSKALLAMSQAVDARHPEGHSAGGRSAVMRLLPSLPGLVRAERHLRQLGVSAAEAIRRGWRPPARCQRDAYEVLAEAERHAGLFPVAAEGLEQGGFDVTDLPV